MLYAYATRFDVMENLENFFVFRGELNKALGMCRMDRME
jgi:hypothetical protein